MLNLLILPLENSGSWMSKVADSSQYADSSHYYTKTTNMTAKINAKKNQNASVSMKQNYLCYLSH